MKKSGNKGFREIRVTVLTIIIVCMLIGCGKAERSIGNDSVEDGTYLLTVDGYGVTEEEFLLFLRDQKAIAANYYWVNYELQPDASFWSTEVDGKTPLEYAKERALETVIKAKEEFIMASERGILEYKDYNSMMENMEEENVERSTKKESEDVFYGLTEYTPFTYYQYLNGNIRSELEYFQKDIAEPTEEQLCELYEANKESLMRGYIYHCTVIYENGESKEISINTSESDSLDYNMKELITNHLYYMEPGNSISDYYYEEETVKIRLNSVEDLGVMSFEEAEDTLLTYFARNEVSRLISERCRTAEIVIDEERYEAVVMP